MRDEKPVTVSIIIPVKPGGYVRAVEVLREVLTPEERVEVIVAEGKSPSRQRNEAAARATGDILYFLDDDSRPAKGFLDRAIALYSDPAVAAAGGPSLTPPDDSLLQRAFGLVLSSLFGGGAMRNRYRKSGSVRYVRDNELILCNLSFRRDLFLQFGGFDERLYPNEENELMDRISAAGWKMVHDPELAVLRSQRTTFGRFVRQLFGYGRGRGEQTILSRKVSVVSLVPPAFLLYLLSLPLVSWGPYRLPLVCYALGVIFFTFSAARSGDPAAALLPLLFPTFHLSYGAGMLRALGGVRRRSGERAEVTLQRERLFEHDTAATGGPGGS